MKKSPTPKIPSNIRPKIKRIQQLTKDLRKLEVKRDKLSDQMDAIEFDISRVSGLRTELTTELMGALSGAVPNDVIDAVMNKL